VGLLLDGGRGSAALQIAFCQLDAIAELGPHPPAFASLRVSATVRESIQMWSTVLEVLNGRSARAPVLRPSVPMEVVTDASLDGWGWAGMGLCVVGAWPVI
jgi:hypothetical protein